MVTFFSRCSNKTQQTLLRVLWWGMWTHSEWTELIKAFHQPALNVPLQDWNPFQCPSLYSGATCVHRANQPLRKKLSDFPDGAADGSLPASGGDRILSQIGKDSTCMGARAGAALPPRHNYWVRPLELLLRIRNGGGRPAKRVPKHCKEEWPQLAATGESPHNATRTQRSQKEKQQLCIFLHNPKWGQIIMW